MNKFLSLLLLSLLCLVFVVRSEDDAEDNDEDAEKKDSDETEGEFVTKYLNHRGP